MAGGHQKTSDRVKSFMDMKFEETRPEKYVEDDMDGAASDVKFMTTLFIFRRFSICKITTDN